MAEIYEIPEQKYLPRKYRRQSTKNPENTENGPYNNYPIRSIAPARNRRNLAPALVAVLVALALIPATYAISRNSHSSLDLPGNEPQRDIQKDSYNSYYFSPEFSTAIEDYKNGFPLPKDKLRDLSPEALNNMLEVLGGIIINPIEKYNTFNGINDPNKKIETVDFDLSADSKNDFNVLLKNSNNENAMKPITSQHVNSNLPQLKSVLTSFASFVGHYTPIGNLTSSKTLNRLTVDDVSTSSTFDAELVALYDQFYELYIKCPNVKIIGTDFNKGIQLCNSDPQLVTSKSTNSQQVDDELEL